jgi:hypothetical protein
MKSDFFTARIKFFLLEEFGKTLWLMILKEFVENHLELIHLRKVITCLFDFVLLIDHIIAHLNDFMI